jgi:hypothetical protein
MCWGFSIRGVASTSVLVSYRCVGLACCAVSQCQSQMSNVKVTLRLTVSQSVHLGVEPTLGLLTRVYFFKRGLVWKFLSCLWGRPLWREVGSVICLSRSIVSCQYVQRWFTFNMFDTKHQCIHNIYIASLSPGSVQQIMPQLLVAFATMAVLDTWTVVHTTAAKFKPLVFPVSGFALSNVGIYLSQSYSHISVEYPTVNSFTFYVTR